MPKKLSNEEREERRLKWAEEQNAKMLDRQAKRFHCKWCKEEFSGRNFIKEDHFKSEYHSENRRKILDKIKEAKLLIEYCKNIDEWEGNGSYCNLSFFKEL